FNVLWCVSISFPEDYALVPLHDRFSLPENPAGACDKGTSFFLKYKAFFHRKRKNPNKYLFFNHQ
ncbi:MAG: hypothetical protein IKW52_05420, partial [Alistipes sp.]|nr:hypothetical protein [Alistipes sp.]